jgi:hypothetical protein
MKGTIKSITPELDVNIITSHGDDYFGKIKTIVPHNLHVGEQVDFNFGSEGINGKIYNKEASVEWMALNDEGRRILDINP